jgi:hypothetical protein
MEDIKLDTLPEDIIRLIICSLPVPDIIELKYVSPVFERYVYDIYPTKTLFSILSIAFKNNKMGYTNTDLNPDDMFSKSLIIESRLPELVVTDETFKAIKTAILFWRRGIINNNIGIITQKVSSKHEEIYGGDHFSTSILLANIGLANVVLLLLSAHKGFKTLKHCIDITKDISVTDIFPFSDILECTQYPTGKSFWRYANWKKYPQIENTMCINTCFKYVLYETTVVICNKLILDKLEDCVMSYLIMSIRYNIIPMCIEQSSDIFPHYMRWINEPSVYIAISELLVNKDNRETMLQCFSEYRELLESVSNMDYFDEIFPCD